MPRRDDIRKILIIGSGPIIIGQACEFDYSGTQACKALKKLGYEIVLVNSNPATIMTDPAMADVTYIEPLNVESLTEIIAREKTDAMLPNLGGKTGLNLSSALAREGILEKYGVQVIGVNVDAIRRGEDRQEFKDTMSRLGIGVPRSEIATNYEEADITVSERDRAGALDVARRFAGMGFSIVATNGTRKFLASNGIAASPILKVHEGRPNIADAIKNGEIHLVVNTPAGTTRIHDDSYIRKAAIKHKVPYITTTAAAIATARGISAHRQGHADVRSLQEYHALIAG